jgi:sugar lactone lactonase YvrE
MTDSPIEAEVVYDDLTWAESPRWQDGVLWISDTQGSRLVELHDSAATVHDVSPPVNGTAFRDGILYGARMSGSRVDRFDGKHWELFADLGEQVGAGALGDLTQRSDGTLYIDDIGNQGHSGKVEANGRLIKVDPKGTATVAAEGLHFPNGIGLIEDEATLVVAETFGLRLTAFSVAADGSLSQPRLWADIGAELGEQYRPDGLWPVSDGSIWVATTGGEAFVRLRDGEVVERIDVGDFAIACCLDDDESNLFLTMVASTDPSRSVIEALPDKQLSARVERHPHQVLS